MFISGVGIVSKEKIKMEEGEVRFKVKSIPSHSGAKI